MFRSFIGPISHRFMGAILVIVFMEFINQLTTRGPHIVDMEWFNVDLIWFNRDDLLGSYWDIHAYSLWYSNIAIEHGHL